MSLAEKIAADRIALFKHRKKAECAILSVLLGEIQQLQHSEEQHGHPVEDTQIIAIIKQLIANNDKTIAKAKLKPGQEVFQKLTLENVLLSSYLPQTISEADIAAILSPHCSMLIEQPSEGNAIGIAIKLVNSRRVTVDNKDVAKLVRSLRERAAGLSEEK